ncbi:DUF3883 domain-containing protein [Streptomyces sp. SID3915]|nr:DUF3883 domain-containing protein [Streptomyces sp. SID3915]
MITALGRLGVDVGEGGFPHLVAGASQAVHWSPDVEQALSQTGTAGECALVALLRGAGLTVTHVSEISDAYGYDIAAVLATGEGMHLEVKSTTDPSRLVVHLTRHEFEVMASDAEWLMAAVLVGADMSALSIAEVSRQWLTSVAPRDQSADGRWESVRLSVPPHALTPGLAARSGYRALPGNVVAVHSAWGMKSPVAASV